MSHLLLIKNNENLSFKDKESNMADFLLIYMYKRFEWMLLIGRQNNIQTFQPVINRFEQIF